MTQKNNINNTFHIELEVLSPLHIGAGSEKDWVETADFVFDDKKVYKLNQKKIIKKIGVDKYSSILLNRNSRELINTLSGEIQQYADESFDNPGVSKNDIKAHIRTGLDNMPYVPGSSLKGAIRSVLLNYFLNGNKPYKDEKAIFGSSTDGDEFMRFIKISDAHFDKTKLVNTKIFNLTQDQETREWIGGWKHEFRNNTTTKFKHTGFNTIYEMIDSGNSGNFTIDFISPDIFSYIFNNIKQQGNFKEKESIIFKGIQYLFDIINNHTESYIKKEIEFFKKYNQAESSDKIISTYEKFLDSIPKDSESAVFRMSAGSGFHGITGDLRFESHLLTISNPDKENKNKRYKSRKIAFSDGNFMPMGFIKLTVLSEEERERSQEEKDKRLEAVRQKKMKEEKERIEQIRLQKQREEEARQEKLRQEEEAKRIEQERIDRENKEKEELEEAKKRKAENLIKRQQANIQEKESRKEEILQKGIVDILDGKDDFDERKKNIEEFYKANEANYIKDKNKEALHSFVKRCIQKNNRRWKKFNKGDWRLIIKWIGEEEAEKWFSGITGK